MKLLDNHYIRLLQWSGNSPVHFLYVIMLEYISRLIDENMKLWINNMDHQYFKDLAKSRPRQLLSLKQICKLQSINLKDVLV